MATKVIMPQLGESVVEGTVSRWLKQIGETITEYDPLVEVSTDKVDTEVPSPATGTLLEILVPEGETVEAGTVLCVIGAANEKVIAEQPAAQTDQKHTNGSNGKAASRDPSRRMSPVVARMVAEHNLDFDAIEGTGRGGRVTRKDVEAYLEQGQPAPTAVKASDIPAWEQPVDGDLFKPTDFLMEKSQAKEPEIIPMPMSSVKPQVRAIPAESVPTGAPGELVHLSGMRKAIAEHMVRSKLHTAPHVTTVFEVDLTHVLAHREAHKDQFAKQGVNLTITAYLIQAMVDACKAYPIINSQWTEDGIYLHHAVHIGMAVAIDDGLIVPVIKNADDLSLLGMARKVNDLAMRARNKQLQPDEVQGGTITITNHGVSGSIMATPIINQPQTAIFGVGMMEKRVKVINDAIAIRPCAYMTLTFDHRVADGSTGDGWMYTLKQTLEQWGVE